MRLKASCLLLAAACWTAIGSATSFRAPANEYPKNPPESFAPPTKNPEGGIDWLKKFESERNRARVGAPLSSIRSRATGAIGVPRGAGRRIGDACANMRGEELIDCLVIEAHRILQAKPGMMCRHYCSALADACGRLRLRCGTYTSAEGGHQWSWMKIDDRCYMVDGENFITYESPGGCP